MRGDCSHRPVPSFARAAGCVGALVLAAVPIRLAGQGKIEFTPFVGMYLPTANEIEFRDVVTTGDKVTAKHKTTVIFGGRLSARVTDRVAVEGSFGYAPSKVEGTYTDPSNATQSSDTTGHVILASARVLVGFGPNAGSASWHLILGGGLVSHGGPAYDGTSGLTDFGGIAGVGAKFKVGPSLAIRVDVEDNLFSARFTDDASGTQTASMFQNDLVLLLGLAVPLGGK
jgi:hypothetical protein